MNRFKAALQLLTRGEKALTTGQSEIPQWMSGKPKWTDWTIRHAFDDGYTASHVVFSGIQKLSRAVSSVPWIAMEKKAGEWQPIEDESHRLNKLMNYPSPRVTRRAQMERLIQHLYLGGNGIWSKLYAGGELIHLYSVTPDVLTPIPVRDSRLLAGYEFRNGSETLMLDADETVHFKFENPMDPFWGLSPLKAGSKIIDMEVEANDFNKQSMENRGIVAGILSFDSTLTEDAYRNARERVNSGIKGKTNSQKILILDRIAKYQKVASTPAELDFLNSRKMTLQDIAMLLDIPLPLLSIMEGATLANVESLQYMFWVNTIIPLLESIKEVMDMLICTPDFGEDYWLVPDLSSVPALQANRFTLAKTAALYHNMGVPFKEINRQFSLGFMPFPGDDIPRMSQAANPAEADESTPADAEDKQSLKKNLRGTNATKAFADQFNKKQDEYQEPITKVIAARFKVESRKLIAAFEANGEEGLQRTLAAGRGEWEEVLEEVYETLIKDFGGFNYATLSNAKAQGFDTFNSRIRKWISRSAAKKVTYILDTTKTALAGVIKKEAEKTTQEIAKAIRETFLQWEGELTTVGRSWVIARTEIGAASNYGHREGALQVQEDLGYLVLKEWSTSQDDRVRGSHQELHQQQRKLNESYSNGLMYPCDPNGAAAEVINCRCAEKHIVL